MRLAVQAPFHLEATVRVLQRRPSNLIDLWQDGQYLRAVRIGKRPALIAVQNLGSVDVPDLKLSTSGALSPAAARRIACEVLGIDQDPAPYQRRAEAHAALRSTAVALRGMRAPCYPDLFETFANVIPYQQLSLEAGMAVVARLVQRFGPVVRLDGRRFHLFPDAETIAAARTAALKQCGLSLSKAQALRSIAEAIVSGALTRESIAALPSPEAIERLVQLRGIGAWSAALVLLRGFRRLDVFPPGDSGAERSLRSLMRLRAGVSLERAVRRFGEFRGLLYFYGLASRLLAAGLIHEAGDDTSFSSRYQKSSPS